MVVKLHKGNRDLLAAMLIGLAVLLVLTFFVFKNPVPSLKSGSYNMLFSWRGHRAPVEDVVIVAIDDKSFEELGAYPWSRDVYGKIIEKLKADNAKIIGLDIEFANPGPVPEKDIFFAKAAKSAGNVLSVATFTEDKIVVEGVGEFPYKKYNLPIKVLNNSMNKTGYTAFDMDIDGVVRKSSLVAFLDDDKDLAKKSYKDAQKVYSFALAAVSMFTGKTEEQVLDGVMKYNVDYKKGVKRGDGTLLINYEGGPKTFKRVSFYRVLNGEIPKETFKDKIVLIGATSTVLHDEFLSPYTEAGNMPGVEIHANVIDDLLKNEYLVKSGIFVNYLVLLVFVATILFFTSRFTPLLSALLSILLYVSFFFLALYLFIKNYWLDISVPFVALILTYVVNVGYRVITEGQKSRKMKGAFQRFVSRQVVDEIIKNGLDNLTVGGRKQKLVVFFSDIRNFTTMAERLAPEEVVEVLNFYFKEMTSIAFKYGGTVDKYIGDAIMVEFGAPLARPNDEELAVRMAIEMQEKMKELREVWKSQGREQFEIGCGINSGEAVVGFMGTDRKMEYSALGDTVNLASRLESLTKEYHASIVISQAVYEKVKDLVVVKDLGFAAVKGKTIKVQIYDVLGLKKL
ncbi:MAG: adenylate/guanylate cyclase domain-containing protein [Candidatus Firestonebacteria bacterium]